MSLILEALKKLEREKQGPERGVVVLASAALAGAPRPRPTAAGPVFVVLALAAAGALAWWALGRTPAPDTAPAAAPTTTVVAEAAPVPITVAPSRPMQRVVVPVEPRPAVAATPATTAATAATTTVAPAVPPVLASLRLTAIGARDGHAVAVINDAVVQVGDLVGDARVVAIGTSHVELELAGERHRISF